MEISLIFYKTGHRVSKLSLLLNSKEYIFYYMEEPMKKLVMTIEPYRFFLSATVCFLLMVIGIIFPESTSHFFNMVFGLCLEKLDWVYLMSVTVFVTFILFMAFSKYGNIRLGKDNELPEHSLFSWLAMLFSAGMGIGLVFFSVAEPMMHFFDPAFSQSQTSEAISEAIYYTLFHWGIHPWACYGIIALTLAYFQFRKGYKGVTSSVFIPLIGKKRAEGIIGKTIDTYTIILTVVGVASAFGLGAVQIKTGLNIVYKLPDTQMVTIAIISVCTVLFTLSTTKGIDRGMKLLSGSNLKIAFLLMCFVFLFGPTSYIIKTFLEGIGNYLSKIIPLSFFSDAQGLVEQRTGYDWIRQWTIFYWAWWTSWAPFVGSFIARISKGRTIKEFIISIFIFPTLLSSIWFSIFGGTGIYFEQQGITNLKDVMAIDSTGAVFEMLKGLPLTGILSTITMVSLLIFFLTSADAATYVVSVMTSGGNLSPDTKIRVFWGVLVGGLSIMYVITGGLTSVQNMIIAFSFPFLLLMLMMIISMLKDLLKDH